MAIAWVKGISKPARLACRRSKARIDCDPYDVVARRNRGLSVAAVKHKELSGQLPDVHVRPAFADALIAWYAGRSAGCEISGVVVRSGVRAVLLDIYHTEAALGCAPNESCGGVNQLIKRVVPEMKMIVT